MNPDDDVAGDAELDATEQAVIDALLARPEVWEDLPPDLEDAVVAAIGAEASPPVVAIGDRSRARPRRRSAWLGAAAAALVLVIGGVLVANGGNDRAGTEVALAATSDAAGASGRAVLSATPAGLKILLDVDGLPGAPDGSYYEAWVSDGTTRVSAGTFHLRRGDDEIELWAGVADPSYDRLAVTLEPLDADNDSSGVVLLTGQFALDG
jgi:hypothetical protein